LQRVTNKRLRELERKELAHDDYLAATRIMRRRAVAVASAGSLRHSVDAGRSYVEGYRDAVTDFASAVLEAALYREHLEKYPAATCDRESDGDIQWLA
jgi:hypothetical protein